MPDMRRVGQRLALVALTIWGLVMVVPDLYRCAHPLAAFGLSVDNDGIVTDAEAPFATEQASPAWQAGLRPGDRLDLEAMRCVPPDTLRCASAQAALGGSLLVTDRRRAEFVLAASGKSPVRTVGLIAATPPNSWTATLVLLLDQAAAIAAVLASAWLVWTRPGRMTWALFLYVVWFNPGQSSVFYALLQQVPAALLLQNLAGAIAQGVGWTGLVVFAVCVPTDRSAARWKPLLRVVPALAAALCLLLAASFMNLFGVATEALTRVGLGAGFIVAAGAFAILLARRSELAAADFQRLRWATWGCLIGLPALSMADLGQQTSLLSAIFGIGPPTDIACNLLRLVNGVLCLFVLEAVRRPRVVSVAIPLRRVTLLGLTLSAPALLLHQQIDHVREWISEDVALPAWAWLVAATVVVFAISRLHETSVHLVDRHFNRHLRRMQAHLVANLLEARDTATVDGVMSARVRDELGLASATLLHCAGSGSMASTAGHLDAAEALGRLKSRRPFDIGGRSASRSGFADPATLPVLAVPIATQFQDYAMALYGEHLSGTAFTQDERALLAEVASRAADAYAKLERLSLLQRVDELERRLGIEATASAAMPG